MGIFSKNTTSLGYYDSSTVVAKEGYDCVSGASMIMVESAINEEKMFNYLIARDFKEAVELKNGGSVNESVEVLTEGVGDILAKLKAMVLKVWEKVKGLFKSFLNKFDSVVMRDTKELYKKHKTEWLNNASNKLKKYKWSKPNYQFDSGNHADIIEKSFGDTITSIEKIENFDNESDLKEDYLDNVLTSLLKLYNSSASTTDAKSFAKDFKETLFEDEETFTNETVSSEIRTEIDKVLVKNKLVSDVKKAASEDDKVFKRILKEIDSARTSMVKKANEKHGLAIVHTAKDDEDTTRALHGSSEIMAKKINLLQFYVSKAQQAINMNNSAYLNAVKFHIAQCRRVFGQVISSRKSNNEATLLDAIGESAEYEVMSSFADYE